MDWNKLQHTLFEMDPTDPAEDMRKLAESASALTQKGVATDVNYVQESVEVQEGSLGLDKDYSVADFAALAGVTLNESQKTGSAGQLKGKDVIKKQPAGTTKNPTRNKLVGESQNDRIAALERRIETLEVLLSENQLTAKTVANEAQKSKPIKARDPSAQYMNDLRRSGAMGAHADKKRDAKMGKQKHKKDYTSESIKEMLYRKLNNSK
jgi:hypothetical protein